MNTCEYILSLAFPEFEQKKESRFSNFFTKTKFYENKVDEKYQLNGYKILTGADKRTTILIKNIPRAMTKNQLKILLEKIANIIYTSHSPIFNKFLLFCLITICNTVL